MTVKRLFLTKEQLTKVKDRYLAQMAELYNDIYDYMLENCTETGEIDDLLEINEIEAFENTDEEIMSRVVRLLNDSGSDDLRNGNFEAIATGIQYEVIEENLLFINEEE